MSGHPKGISDHKSKYQCVKDVVGGLVSWYKLIYLRQNFPITPYLNAVIFLDLKKAFVTVEQNTPLCKLDLYGISENSLIGFSCIWRIAHNNAQSVGPYLTGMY